MQAVVAFGAMQQMPTEFDDQKDAEKYNEMQAYQIANGGVNVNPLVDQEGNINLVNML